jgi:hypothetical protein
MEQMIPPHVCRQSPSEGYWVHMDSQCIVVPLDQEVLQKIMTTWHNHPTSRHPGHDETTHKVAKTLWWPGMQTWIADYIQGCATCQQNKNLMHKTRIPAYHISVQPEATPFSQIALDLITGFPNSHGYDAILTIVNHGCSHTAVFLPCTIQITGIQIAQLYLKHIYQWFRLPDKVISDRDPHFTLHFGCALAKELDFTQNISMAFHPQTDGLTEHSNQWVKQYLCLVTANQDEWSKWLPVATTVHNNGQNSTTDFPPSVLLIGYEPRLTPSQNTNTNNQAVSRSTQQLKEYRELATQALNKVAYAFKPTTELWAQGQQVWLEAKNLSLPYGTIKLAPCNIMAPSQSPKSYPLVAYQLALPPNGKSTPYSTHHYLPHTWKPLPTVPTS